MTNKTLYPLRKDIQIDQIKEDGEDKIVLNDIFSYSKIQVILNFELFWVLNAIDKPMSLDDLALILNVNIDDIIPYIDDYDLLDKHYFIESPHFTNYKNETDKDFLNNPIRESILADHSFPKDQNLFQEYTNNIFNLIDKDVIEDKAYSTIIPHLDLITGIETQKNYAKSYHSLRNNEFDLIVIFGTAHYRASHRFMLSNKNFDTPNGIINTDIELINTINQIAPNSFIIDEYAHKPEHSIEIQVALSSQYFKNNNFKILPILVSGYFDFIENKQNPDNDKIINLFIDSLHSSIDKLGRKPIFIASVDFSHIGIKFGDEFDAREKAIEVNKYDNSLIRSILNNDYDEFYHIISEVDDKWKICGTSSIYTLLKYQSNKRAQLLDYHLWYENLTKSAVSCASISFYNK